MPPNKAIAMAIGASVTVSMSALMNGVFRGICRVNQGCTVYTSPRLDGGEGRYKENVVVSQRQRNRLQ